MSEIISNIVKGDIGNALHSVSSTHIVTTADEIYDEAKQDRQSTINANVAAEIGSDSTPNTIKGRLANVETNDITTAIYDSTNKTINFYNASNVKVSEIDATDFIKDGMIDTIAIVDDNLVISFNTDSGKQAINIPLTSFFDSSQYYNKTDINKLICDVSVINAVSNQPKIYNSLSSAIAAVPNNSRKGGITLKFRNNNNKYEEWHLISDVWSDNESNWKSIDDVVRINTTQSLTSTQKATTLSNLGIDGIDDTPITGNTAHLITSDAVHTAIESGITGVQQYVDNNALKYTQQSLTSAQKEQALANVGISGIDAAPVVNSTNLVKSGGVYNAIDNVAFSTNEHVNTIGIDETPTAESSNLVTSGGVFNECVKSIKLNKGYYVHYNTASQTYSLLSYSPSIITEALILPKKPVTFYNYWKASTEDFIGYPLIYLDSNFNFIGGKMFESNNGYLFNPAIEDIPENSKYIIIQSQQQDNKVYYISEENLGTGINVREAILNKNNIDSLNSDVSKLITSAASAVKKESPVNLFNKNDLRIQTDKFITGTETGIGSITDLEGCSVTHPIFVEANTIIKVPYNVFFGDYNRLMYVDDNKLVYATLEMDGDTKIAFLYQIPRSGYVLFNYRSTQKETLMICIKDEFPNEYVPYYCRIEEGVDFSNQQKADILTLTSNKANLTTEHGKNLFNKSEVIYGYYLNSDTGNLVPNVNSAISPKIEITPGSVYHISRPNVLNTGVVVFIDEDENRLKPLKIDGTEWSSCEPHNGDTGNTYQECKCKVPATAKYIQFTIIFMSDGSINNTQIELGEYFTGYEEYYEKKVLPYAELPSKLIQQLNDTSERIINIANSDKIGIFSTSFMNGYCMKNHHHINNLSMFSDYIFYNYGHSGDDELENLDKLENDQTWLGVIPPSKWNVKYGIVMHQENSGALKSASSDTIYENSKKLANAIKSLGGIPIFSTEHDSDYVYYQGAIRLCNEEGYMFMRWGTLAKKLFNTVFAPFWLNSHPSTRTGWMITNGMLPYIQSLPRPNQCIKLFRVRENIDTTNLQNLIFEDLYTRAQRYIELTCGVSALTTETEKYFDRLDADGKVFANINDEYQYIQNKQSVSFGNFAMINLILPYTKVGLKSIKLYFNSVGVSNVYIQKIRQISNSLPATRYVAFEITQGANLIQPGDTFAVTGGVYNDDIEGNYTVSGIINGMLITTTNSIGKTTSGTDTPSITSDDFDVLDVNLTGSYDYPSYDYISRYKNPLGEWIEITSEQLDDGGYNLNNYIDTCMNFDSIAILLKGTDISMSDVYANVSGTEPKLTHSIPMLTFKKGVSLITDSLLDDNTSWEGISSIASYDNTQTISTISSSYETLPVGITTVKEFQQGQSIRQSILSSVLNNNNEYGEPIKIQIRVIARYFPKYINSDTEWETSEVTEQSFDVARFSIYFGDTASQANPTKVAEFNVGAWWNEFITETYCTESKLNYIKAMCTNKKVQVAKIEIVKL